MAGQGQKTEKPTQQRLKKAREDGQFPVAKEFVAAMQFLGAVVLLRNYGGAWLDGIRDLFRHALVRAFQPDIGFADYISLSRELLVRAFVPIALGGSVLVGITLAVQLVTTGLGFSGKRLLPSLKQLNPISKLTHLPKQNAVALVQVVFLVALTGGCCLQDRG